MVSLVQEGVQRGGITECTRGMTSFRGDIIEAGQENEWYEVLQINIDHR